SGHRLRHRPRPARGRGRRPRRAQDCSRLPAADHLFRPLHRRPRLAPRRRTLPRWRARPCRAGGARADRGRAVPQGQHTRRTGRLTAPAPPAKTAPTTAGAIMTSYDTDNIFAKILRGELPSYKIYEDEHTFVFLDIMPRCPGHALVIPKAAARNIFDISADDFAHVARTTHKVARAAMKAFAADGIVVAQFSEPAAGQEVY